MFGMGCLLSRDDFLARLREPKSLIVALLLQWIALPILALVIGCLHGVPDGIAAGLILVASVPTGVTGNVLTYYGRGNIALSVSITAITTVVALVYLPLMMRVLLMRYLPPDFQFPLQQIIHDIVFNLAIPLLLGLYCHTRLSRARAEKLGQWMVRLSLLLIVVMAVGAGHTGRLNPKAYGVMGIAWLALFCLGIVVIALIASLVARLPPADRLAILIKSNYRNISLAVAIKTVMFPTQSGLHDPVGDAAFFTVLLYGGICLVTSLLITVLHRLTLRISN